MHRRWGTGQWTDTGWVDGRWPGRERSCRLNRLSREPGGWGVRGLRVRSHAIYDDWLLGESPDWVGSGMGLCCWRSLAGCFECSARMQAAPGRSCWEWVATATLPIGCSSVIAATHDRAEGDVMPSPTASH